MFTATAADGGRGGGSFAGAGDPRGRVPQGRPDLLDVDLDDGAPLPLAGVVGAIMDEAKNRNVKV